MLQVITAGCQEWSFTLMFKDQVQEGDTGMKEAEGMRNVFRELGKRKVQQPKGLGLPMRGPNQPQPGQHRECVSLATRLDHSQSMHAQKVHFFSGTLTAEELFEWDPLFGENFSAKRFEYERDSVIFFCFVQEVETRPCLQIRGKDLAKKEDSAERVQIKRCQRTT